jgi:hypothetical protein
MFGAASAIALFVNGFAGKASEMKTRGEFVNAIAQVKEGMTEAAVVALLGKPDDVRTHRDPGGISTARTKEIWRYGTDGHLTFATLGCVYIDNAGKAQYVYGGSDSPPDEKAFSEEELRRLLRIIDKAPGYYSGYGYDPRRIVEAVNALQPLGKEKAIAALTEYLRVASHFHDSGREGVFLILRCLFEVPADPGFMPHMYCGAPSMSPPEDAKKAPRFPIVIHGDVPLLLIRGYTLAGRAEQPESHLEYFRKHGQIRKQPLVPTDDPLAILKELSDIDWILNNAHGDYDKLLVANQLLNLIDSVHRMEPTRHGTKFWVDRDVEEHWEEIHDKVAKLSIRWSRDKQCYVFQDDTRLPEPALKIRQREIWELDGLNGEAEVIVERTDTKHVSISLSWSGEINPGLPTYELTVFVKKDKNRVLERTSTSSIAATANNEAHQTDSFAVELPEGTEIQLRLVVGKREETSPTYVP